VTSEAADLDCYTHLLPADWRMLLSPAPTCHHLMSSGAGPRSLGDLPSAAAPVKAKKEGSVKKKAKSSSGAAAAASSAAGSAAAAASADSVARVDHLSAASASDSSLLVAREAAAANATASAFPHLTQPYNAEEDVDEEIDEEALKQQMEDMMKEEDTPSVGRQSTRSSESSSAR